MMFKEYLWNTTQRCLSQNLGVPRLQVRCRLYKELTYLHPDCNGWTISNGAIKSVHDTWSTVTSSTRHFVEKISSKKLFRHDVSSTRHLVDVFYIKTTFRRLCLYTLLVINLPEFSMLIDDTSFVYKKRMKLAVINKGLANKLSSEYGAHFPKECIQIYINLLTVCSGVGDKPIVKW